MATKTWIGNAAAVAQESRATPANVEVDDVFTLICNGRSVSFTATAATVANVTAGLATAWNASTVTEHAEITASDETTYLKLLGDTAGVPFTVTSSVTDGGGTDDQTLAITTPTAAAGPNHWDTADNWSGDAVPVNSDDVVLENTSDNIMYGLDQSAVTLSDLVIRKSFTGTIGLPIVNATGSYVEYRDRALKIGTAGTRIGEGVGTGSTRINIEEQSTTAKVHVFDTGVYASTGGERPVQISGTISSGEVNVYGGTVGLASQAGETINVATLRVPGGDVLVGGVTASTTVGTATIDGGTVDVNGGGTYAITTWRQYSGTTTMRGAPTVTNAIEILGGTCYYQITSTEAVTLGTDAVLDCRQDLQSRTISAISVYSGAAIYDPAKTVTWSTGIDLVQCSPGDVTLDIGVHQTLTPSAI